MSEDPAEFRRRSYDHVAFASKESQVRYIKLNCKYRAVGRVKNKSTANIAREYPPS